MHLTALMHSFLIYWMFTTCSTYNTHALLASSCSDQRWNKISVNIYFKNMKPK